MCDYQVQDWMELVKEEELPHLSFRKADEFQDEQHILNGSAMGQSIAAGSTASHSADQQPPSSKLPSHDTTQQAAIDHSLLMDLENIRELFLGPKTLMIPKSKLKGTSSFRKFATTIGSILKETSVPPPEQAETSIEFAEQLLLALYPSLNSDEYNELSDKLKILRLEKRKEEKKKKTKKPKQPTAQKISDDFM